MSKINLQMYSFHDGTMEDYRQNLKTAAEMGYDGVELFGPCFDIPVDEMKTLLSDVGLEVVSMHVMTDMVMDMIPYAKGLGLKYMGIAMENMFNEEEVHAYAEKLNGLGKACDEEGIRLTYHNHTQEFAVYGDKTIMDILVAETDPNLVSFELDAGWCAAAGHEPIEIVKKYSGRIKLIHLKESSEAIGPQPPLDFASFEKDEMGRIIIPDDVKESMAFTKSINCPAGEGIVDWAALKTVADEHGCEAYVVERERTYEGTRVECLQADLNYYKEVMS